MTSCRVITDHKYFINKYGYCFAWTDDPEWEQKIRARVEQYRLIH